MQVKPKANTVVTTSHDPVARTLTFAVRDCEPLILHLDKVSDANKARGLIHGFNQRVVDAAARARDTATGAAKSPAEKRAAMARIVDHLNSGAETWSPEREGGQGPGLDAMILAAVAEATGRDVEGVRAMVAAGAEAKKVGQREYLAALGTAKAVAPILARMRAQGSGVDADEELDAMVQGG